MATAKLTMKLLVSLTLIDEAEVLAVYSSQRCCAHEVALLVFRVSMPSMASTARPERCELSFMDSLMWRDNGRWTMKPTMTTIGIIAKGTNASLPPTIEITKINSNRNGKSTKVNRLALVMNSRTDSNSRRLLAYEPDEAGRSARRNAITRRNKAELIIRSAFLPAMSVKWPRIILAANSNKMARTTPILKTHRVS